MKNMHVIVFVTASSPKEAEKIAHGLLGDKLAACVNIIKGISSLFFWNGKIDNAKEAMLIIKTKKTLIAKVIKKVKSLHSYEVPEIIAIPIMAGEKKYLNWINESTR